MVSPIAVSWATKRPDLCAIPHRLDRMSTGHLHGTDETRPRRDGCGPEVRVSCQISLCLLGFFSLLEIYLGNREWGVPSRGFSNS